MKKELERENERERHLVVPEGIKHFICRVCRCVRPKVNSNSINHNRQPNRKCKLKEKKQSIFRNSKRMKFITVNKTNRLPLKREYSPNTAMATLLSERRNKLLRSPMARRAKRERSINFSNVKRFIFLFLCFWNSSSPTNPFDLFSRTIQEQGKSELNLSSWSWTRKCQLTSNK